MKGIHHQLKHINLFKVTKLPLIVLFLLINSVTILKAQYYSQYGGLTGGVFGGMTMSQINGDGFKGFDKYGYTGGGILILPVETSLPFDGTIAYSLGVQFTQKGAVGAEPGYGIKKQVIDLNYAEMPVMIHYYRGHRASNIGLGLCIGYLAWEETLVDRGMGLAQIENHYNKMDLSMVINPNIHLYKGIYLSPRWQYTLVNIKNKKPASVGRTEQYNYLLSFSLMYVFNRQ